MREAYALLGILWLIVLAGGWYAFNLTFTRRADTEAITSSSTPLMTSTLKLSSSAFAEGGSIPALYTCDGEQTSPPLSISGVPTGTKSLALITEDPDVPKALMPDGLFVHWVLFNIPPETTAIPEGASVGTEGDNGSGQRGYTGPCPPTDHEPSEHRYFFHLYALDTMLDLRAGASKDDVVGAMGGHIIAETQLVGKYRRVTN